MSEFLSKRKTGAVISLASGVLTAIGLNHNTALAEAAPPLHETHFIHIAECDDQANDETLVHQASEVDECRSAWIRQLDDNGFGKKIKPLGERAVVALCRDDERGATVLSMPVGVQLPWRVPLADMTYVFNDEVVGEDILPECHLDALSERQFFV